MHRASCAIVVFRLSVIYEGFLFFIFKRSAHGALINPHRRHCRRRRHHLGQVLV